MEQLNQNMAEIRALKTQYKIEKTRLAGLIVNIGYQLDYAYSMRDFEAMTRLQQEQKVIKDERDNLSKLIDNCKKQEQDIYYQINENIYNSRNNPY